MSAIQQILAATGGATIVSPISLIAHTKVGGDGVATPAINTTGATLIVVVTGRYAGGGVITSVTDSKGNTYVALTDYVIGGGDGVQVYYCKNPIVGAGHTVTVNAPSTFPSISVAAFNLTDTTANADQENGATNVSSATLATGSVTPSTDNQLIVAGVAHDQASQTINAGFTIADSIAYSPGTYIGSGIAYLVQTTATAVNPTWNASVAGNICAAIATFKHS